MTPPFGGHREVESVWAINEWDPNSWAPPGDEPWDQIGAGYWRDTGSGSSITWTPEWGNGSGSLTLAA